MTEKIVDPRAEAMKYMNENKVNILFDYLGAKLAKDKPANPNEYLVQELEKISEMQAAKNPVRLYLDVFIKLIIVCR
jgi:hypothetical protein